MHYDFHLVWTGRGGYNTSFNSPVISVPELQEMGGVRKRSWIQLLAKRCLAVFNRVQSLMRSLTKVGMANALQCSIIVESIGMVFWQRWFRSRSLATTSLSMNSFIGSASRLFCTI